MNLNRTVFSALLYALNIISVILLLGIYTIRSRDLFLGHRLTPHVETRQNSEYLSFVQRVFPSAANLKQQPDGDFLITDNLERKLGELILSAGHAPDVRGYSGPTPLAVILDADRTIIKVELLKNSEDGPFLQTVIDSGLLKKWDRLKVDDAAGQQIDAVTGATFSSTAIIQNMSLTLRALQAVKVTPVNANPAGRLTVLNWACLGVIALAAILALFFKQSRILRKIQLWLNIIVLGVLSGQFISLSSLSSRVADGYLLSGAGLIVGAMIVLALVMPLMTGRNVYCFWLCPFGSLQETAGSFNSHKLVLPAKLAKVLGYSRGVIFGLLLFLWSCNLGFELVSAELFPAMLWSAASATLIFGGILVVIASLFIARPYCRFVCPTGFLVDLIQPKLAADPNRPNTSTKE